MIPVERLTELRLYPLKEGIRSPFPTEAAAHSEVAVVGEGVESAQRWDRLAGRLRSKPRKTIRMMDRGSRDRV